MPVAGIQLCDYIFQDEKREEIAERFKELFDLDVDMGKLEMDCERSAGRTSADLMSGTLSINWLLTEHQ